MRAAARQGDLLRVQAELAEGAELEAAGQTGALKGIVGERDAFGRTALHLAAWEGHAAVVAELCRAGAEVSAGAQDSLSALHFAASKGRTEAVRRLLNAGAAVNARSRKGATPILLACRQGAAETAMLLLARRADPLRSDHAGRTPLQSLPAAGSGDSEESRKAREDLDSLRQALEAAATEATALRERIAQGMKPGNRRQRKRPARSHSTGDDSDAGEEEGGGVIGPPEMPAVIGPADMPGADPPLSAPIGPGPPPEGLKRRKVVMSSYLRDSSDEER